jgi:predicted nucleotidyltransferase
VGLAPGRNLAQARASERLNDTQGADMESIPEALLEEIVRRLTAEFDPERIIIFGSHAWGKPTEDSDIDLFVILTQSDERPTQRAIRVRGCLRGLDASFDILVETRAEFDRRATVPASLEAEVLERGRVIYGRGKKGAGPELARQGVA